MTKVRNILTGTVYSVPEVVLVIAGHIPRDRSESERMVRISSSVWGGEPWAPSLSNRREWVPVEVL